MGKTCAFSAFLASIFICLIFNLPAQAQIQLTSITDFGETNVSEGGYFRSSLLGSYQFGRNRMELGSSFNLMSSSSNIYAGTTVKVLREFFIKDFPFEMQGLFIHLPFSAFIHETDWGFLCNLRPGHFAIKLGSSFRRYRITKMGRENYDITSNVTLKENWNLVYLIGYHLKPADHQWNAGITITNLDNFLINQETNPMLLLHGKYRISSPISIFMEFWYKNAGSLNISANQFGYLIRMGLTWELKLGQQQ